MLFPRYKLRTGLIALTVAAMVSIVLREAWAERAWAVGATIGLLSVVALFALHAAVFGAALAVSRGRETPGDGANQ